MRLRIEKHFNISHILTRRLLQIVRCQIVEILLFQQDSHSVVVDSEERGEGIELIRLADFLGSRVRKFNAISLGENKFSFRRKRSFDMEVEFDFWEAVDKGVHDKGVGTDRQSQRRMILLVVVSLLSYVSQIILHPVYGSVGTRLHHYNVLFAVCLVGLFPIRLSKQTEELGMILLAAPLTVPFLFKYSGSWGPIYGPILTQAAMTWPCAFLASNKMRKLAVAIPPMCWAAEKILVQYVQPWIGIVWSRFSALLYLGAFTYRKFFILPYILFVLNQPHVKSGVTPALLARLPPEYTYLDRR